MRPKARRAASVAAPDATFTVAPRGAPPAPPTPPLPAPSLPPTVGDFALFLGDDDDDGDDNEGDEDDDDDDDGAPPPPPPRRRLSAGSALRADYRALADAAASRARKVIRR